MTRLSLFLLAASALAQPEPAVIEGTVSNAVTGQPLRKARVQLMQSSTQDEAPELVTTTTDSQGHYSFSVNVPGSYRLVAGHDGYLAQVYGASKPGPAEKGTLIAVSAGDSKTKTDVRLTALGAITGRVLDESGDPVRQVEVYIMKWTYGPAGRTLEQQQASPTDDLGAYRLYDLPPGKYYLRARPSQQEPGADDAADYYAPVYYPNVVEAAAAAPVTVGPGQDQRGIDFVLHTVATGFVRGRVVKPSPDVRCNIVLGDSDADHFQGFFANLNGLNQILVYASSSRAGTVGLSGFTSVGGRKARPAGEFEFLRVPAGSHSIIATCPNGEQQYVAKVPIQVASPGVDGIVLRPVPPSTVSGSVAIEGESKAKLSEIRVLLSGDETTNGPTDVQVKEDGSFAIENVSAAVYHVTLTLPADLYLKAVTLGSQDIRESGIDLSNGGGAAEIHILVSANGATLSGSVENGEGAAVILAPADPHMEPQSMIAGRNGEFSFAILPPGRYSLLAWQNVDVNAALYDPDLKKQFESSAQTIDLQEKQKATVQLKAVTSGQ